MKTKIKMTFDPDVAREVGTDAAIILSNIEYWVQINKANNHNFVEGRYWTYNSITAFNQLFNYLTPSKIRTCLEKLLEKGYILKDYHNKKNYDRTAWYTTNDNICEISHIVEGKNAKQEVENSKPIPNIKQQIKNSNKNNTNNVPTNVGTSSEKNSNEVYFEETPHGKLVKTKNLFSKNPTKKEPLKPAAAVSKILYTDFKNKDDAKEYFNSRNPLHVGIAYDFHFQFVANCKELDVPTTSIDKANIRKDIETVRLMIERDGANVDQFKRALKVLKVDVFWKKNCQSIDTLRKQFTKLAAKELEKNAKSNSTEPTIKALNHDYIPPSY